MDMDLLGCWCPHPLPGRLVVFTAGPEAAGQPTTQLVQPLVEQELQALSTFRSFAINEKLFMNFMSRRNLIAGSAALFSSPYIVKSKAALIEASAGAKTVYFSQAQGLINTLQPWRGVTSYDLTSDGLGSYPQRINLSNRGGYSLIPQEATKFRVSCNLLRSVTGSAGVVDVSLLASLPGFEGTEIIDTFGTEAFSNGVMFPVASLPESVGKTIEFPNMVLSDGSWGNFFWQMRGNFSNGLNGAGVILQLLSYDVPSSSALPSSWPVKCTGQSAFLMYFGSNLNDSSSTGRTVTAMGAAALQSDGGCLFNGSSGYLTFNGSDSAMAMPGDFTVEGKVSTTDKSMHGGTQRRIISFGGGVGYTLGIGIDPTSGALIILREQISQIFGGHAPINTGVPMTFKLRRKSGVCTLHVNEQQDGQPFTDTTSWAAPATAEIGRLNGGAGNFNGSIYNINIVNGAAI
jgi:hypothetical protein